MRSRLLPVEEIEALFAGEGLREYFGEDVSQARHMFQAASLAEAAEADRELVAAALLHDVGHFKGALSGRDLMEGTDNHHAQTGAAWLAQWFPPSVTEPVRLHVAAKRYLCATEPGYFEQLSPASVHSLSVQGGPMDDTEVAAFAALTHAQDAVAVRRWDDQAKDPERATPGFDHFRALLEELLA